MLELKLKEDNKIVNLENVTSRMLKEIAIMISEDITGNMERERVVSQNIGGDYQPAPPIDPDYVEWKKRQGFSPRIFRKEENMINEVKFKRSGSLSYKIFMEGVSENYASYVNNKRKFFGISKYIIEQIESKFKKMKLA